MNASSKTSSSCRKRGKTTKGRFMIANAKLEKRHWARARLSFVARMRPSLPTVQEFDEVLVTLNSSRSGCYFTTDSTRYKKHLRLFVMVPFSNAVGALNRDYLGEVVRVEELQDGRKGVAVNLLTSIGLSREEQSQKPASTGSTTLGQIGRLNRG